MRTIDSSTFAELVAERVAELGGKVSAIEKAVDLKPDAIRNVLRSTDKAGPTLSRAREICAALGLEFYVGPPRPSQTSKFDSTLKDKLAVGEFERVIDELGKLGYPGIDEFAYVSRFDVKLSAGPGTNGDNARELAQVAFRKDWMRQVGLVADQCVVCNVCGQSMEPLLHDGDLVLIDRRKADVRNGQVYAVVDIEGDVRIKRLEKINGGLLLRSDNPTHRPDARMGQDANDVTIIGRLAWSGHTYDPMKPASSPAIKHSKQASLI